MTHCLITVVHHHDHLVQGEGNAASLPIVLLYNNCISVQCFIAMPLHHITIMFQCNAKMMFRYPIIEPCCDDVSKKGDGDVLPSLHHATN